MKIRISKPHNLEILLFLKVISDMFYQLQILDILLTGLAALVLLYAACSRRLRLVTCDTLVLLIAALFTISFLKDSAYFRTYVKIMSAYVLYFLGRYYYFEADRISNMLKTAFFAVFVINIGYCLFSEGTVVWGSAITLKGLYYFKTDFSAMIAYFAVFLAINEKKYKLSHYILFILAGIFTVLTNARIYYLIYALLVCVAYIYKKNWKLISNRTCMLIIVFAFLGVFSVVILPRLPVFLDRQMIGLRIESISDLFADDNTQGRNVIWSSLFSAFSKQSLFTQLFGAGLSFNDVYGLAGFGEHSSYMKTLINTGYVGLISWLVFLFSAFRNMRKETNRRTTFISFMLLVSYSLASVSSSAISFTQLSWFPMLYCGMLLGTEKASHRGIECTT